MNPGAEDPLFSQAHPVPGDEGQTQSLKQAGQALYH